MSQIGKLLEIIRVEVPETSQRAIAAGRFMSLTALAVFLLGLMAGALVMFVVLRIWQGRLERHSAVMRSLIERDRAEAAAGRLDRDSIR